MREPEPRCAPRAPPAARNPAALFVPCHRIVRSGGGLGGFGYGLPVKRWLLDHEEGASQLSGAGAQPT